MQAMQKFDDAKPVSVFLSELLRYHMSDYVLNLVENFQINHKS